MEDQTDLVTRWRYLRGLLIEQLDALESGALQMHSNEVNISIQAISKLKTNVAEFDALIARSQAR
ncbi:hypothetical protein [Phenylobacterium deserti]|uniref:Uncharacterized protein n=1 Tax=Phenylobacterium deserti TaxID=1914756 RepID=A0A328ASK5_9CAUL|nr:hypothetical protein [Phenylobacterium deserti]RAK58053.1 hypothetical protein DJ018_09130 [Phenylobacterium deserti]